MVSPARKRGAVVHLEGKFQVSQRRACRSLAQPRSTQRYVCRQSVKDAVLAGELRRFATRHPRAMPINEVGFYDFVFEQTEDGKRLKWLPICDEFTCESIALEGDCRMKAVDVVRVLEAAVIARGCAPKYIRSDNGPECVARAVREWIAAKGIEIHIKPGSPWQNAYSESFNSWMRDELLSVESFSSLLEAKVLGKEY